MKHSYFGIIVLAITAGCSSNDQGANPTREPRRSDTQEVATSDIEGRTDTEDTGPTPSATGEDETATPSVSNEPATESDTPTQDEPQPSATIDDTSSDLQDADSDGWLEGEDLDCDDDDPSVNPSEPEQADNGVDDNCDGRVDEAIDTESQACDGEDFDIELLPPKLMLLLDMSGSMTESPPTPTKWEQARSALSNLVTAWQDKIEFGLDVFPDDGNCGVDQPVVQDVSPTSGTAILDYLAAAPTPQGEALTPLCKALVKFANADAYAPQLMSGSAQRFLVLVSDGEDRCGGALNVCQNVLGLTLNTHLTKATGNLLADGIHTFVIGFGGGVSPAQLNAIAGAGGTSLSTYLDASDQVELEAALLTIATAVESCTFTLKSPDASADPEKVNFYFGDDAVPFSAACASDDGWDWADAAHTAITLCPTACPKLGNGAYGPLTAKFGCKQIIN